MLKRECLHLLGKRLLMYFTLDGSQWDIWKNEPNLSFFCLESQVTICLWWICIYCWFCWLHLGEINKTRCTGPIQTFTQHYWITWGKIKSSWFANSDSKLLSHKQTKQFRCFSQPFLCANRTKPCPIFAEDIYFRREAEVDRPDESWFCQDQTLSCDTTSLCILTIKKLVLLMCH